MTGVNRRQESQNYKDLQKKHRSVKLKVKEKLQDLKTVGKKANLSITGFEAQAGARLQGRAAKSLGKDRLSGAQGDLTNINKAIEESTTQINTSHAEALAKLDAKKDKKFARDMNGEEIKNALDKFNNPNANLSKLHDEYSTSAIKKIQKEALKQDDSGNPHTNAITTLAKLTKMKKEKHSLRGIFNGKKQYNETRAKYEGRHAALDVVSQNKDNKDATVNDIKQNIDKAANKLDTVVAKNAFNATLRTEIDEYTGQNTSLLQAIGTYLEALEAEAEVAKKVDNRIQKAEQNAAAAPVTPNNEATAAQQQTETPTPEANQQQQQERTAAETPEANSTTQRIMQGITSTLDSLGAFFTRFTGLFSNKDDTERGLELTEQSTATAQPQPQAEETTQQTVAERGEEDAATTTAEKDKLAGAAEAQQTQQTQQTTTEEEKDIVAETPINAGMPDDKAKNPFDDPTLTISSRSNDIAANVDAILFFTNKSELKTKLEEIYTKYTINLDMRDNFIKKLQESAGENLDNDTNQVINRFIKAKAKAKK